MRHALLLLEVVWEFMVGISPKFVCCLNEQNALCWAGQSRKGYDLITGSISWGKVSLVYSKAVSRENSYRMYGTIMKFGWGEGEKEGIIRKPAEN